MKSGKIRAISFCCAVALVWGNAYEIAAAAVQDASETTASGTTVQQSDVGNGLKILSEPTDFSGKSGERAYFKVVAEGTDLTYGWEYSTDNGETWAKSNCKSATASCLINEITDGRLYRCTVTDGNGNQAVTQSAVIHCVSFSITSQPVDFEGEKGTKASFTVETDGTGLSYKWEYSKDNGSTWVTSATKTNTAQCNINENTNGWLYRCTVTDSKGSSLVSNSAKVVLQSPLEITSQPVDYEGEKSTKATFTVEAKGTGLSYKWEYSKDNGSTWVTSATKAKTAMCNITENTDGWLYRCTVTDSKGNSVVSNSAKVVLLSPLEITTQPVDYEGEKSTKATFTVEAKGTGLTYKWEYSKDNGNTWVTSATKKNTAQCNITENTDGWIYRCTVTDSKGNSVVSDSAKVVLLSPLEITTQPVDYEGEKSTKATFTVEAKGTGLTYKWEYSKDNGETWVTSATKKNTAQCNITENTDGWIYRCTVTDSKGNSVVSDSAKVVLLSPLEITTQPVDYEGEKSTKASFTVEAKGTGLTYKWEYSKDNGETWVTSATKKNTAQCNINENTDGWLYRCTVTDSKGNSVVSESAKVVLLSPLEITSQPVDYEGEKGTKASFTVEAKGTGLTYKWEYSKDNGETWVTSATKTNTAQCSINGNTDGWLYRCTVTDTKGNSVVSDPARVVLQSSLEITLQPVDFEDTSGTKATFEVEATGTGLSYKWEYSKDNGETWVTSSYKTSIAQCTVNKNTDGWLYRCTVTDSKGNSVVSNAARVILFVPLEITSQTVYVEGDEGIEITASVEATGIGLSYKWEYSEDNGETWITAESTTDTIGCTVNEDTDGRLYRCTVTDSKGDSVVSDPIEVVMTKIHIITQPSDTYAPIGGKAVFNIETREKGLSYQWEYSTDGGESWIKSNSTSTQASCNVSAKSDGWIYRCIVTDSMGYSVVSDDAYIRLSDLTIKKQPQGVLIRSGETDVMFVEATGIGLTYTWEKYNGEDWEVVKDYPNDENFLELTADYDISGSYRCVVTDENGNTVISDTAEVTVFDEGFEVIDGKTYYRLEDGSFAKGFYYIDGETYYFYNSGAMALGMVTVDGVRYFFDTETGIELYGFQSNGAYTYYFLEDGGVQKGLAWIDENLYYFGESSGNILTGWRTIGGGKYYFNPNGYNAAIGFTDIDGKTYYFDSEGICYTGGFEEVDDEYYYFNESGSIKKGRFDIDGVKYIADDETGVIYTGYYINPNTALRYYYDGINGMVTGWKDMSDGTHYFYDTGIMARGVTKINNLKYYFDWYSGTEQYGLIDIGMGNYMYFGDDGVAVSGFVTIDGNTYYFDPTTYQSRSEWLEIDGDTYYFDKNSYTMQTGFCTIDGYEYYFAEDGVLQYGLFEADGDYYYTYDSGRIRNGEFYVDGVYYLADSETGVLYTGFYGLGSTDVYYYRGSLGRVTGVIEIDGSEYLFSDSGKMLTGIQTVDGVRCYYDRYTGQRDYGMFTVNGLTYYFTEDGVLTGLNEVSDGDEFGLYYFADEYGYAVSGMKTVDQNTYYFDKSSYKAVKGWQFINGTTYYFDENGCMLKDGIYEIDGNNYYFYPSGKMGKGYIKPYYFDPVTGAQVTGFVNTNGYTYYFTKEGVLTGLQNIDGKLYYFNSNGVMQRGFQKITVDGVATRYYFDPSTGEALTGIATSNGNIYYFDGANGSISGLATVDGVVHNFLSDTTASKSCIKIIDSVGYYFDANGEQRCGFITNNGYEYYFYPNGGYASKTSEKNAISEELDSAEDGFVTVSGVTYYKEYGSLVKGFRTIDGDVYYFAEDNGEMLTGLRTIDGDCYYFSEDGVMQTGAVTLEGGVSYFGEDGKRLSGAVEGSYYNQLGQKRSGIISDSGKLYSYNDNVVSGFVTTDSGLMCYVEDNEIQTGLIDIDGSEYYFDTQGVMQSGMITVDGVSMYFDPDTGARLFGFVERNGKTFYMDREKGMLTGLVEIDGDTYYFDYLGVMSTGMVSIDSDSYYFNNGTGNLLTGWIDDGGDLLYADTETGILKKGIAEIDGNSFYFNTTSCRMMTGWVSDGDNLYYFDNEGIRQTGFTVVGERTYYLGESGYLTGLNEINGETYYFNDYGVMLTGEQTIDGKAYYFDRTTGRRLTGLIRNGKYYYGYLEEGGLASGIATLSDGKTYYFKETNNAAEFGLRSFEDGKLYYFDEEEGMRKDTSWETEGITYTADSDGVITMTADSDNKVAQMICAGAKYLGTTYGSGDGQLVCSSFVTEALKSIGVELTGTAAIQYSLLFDDENVQEFYYFDDLKAGDIVFYVNGDCGDGETCGCIGEIHHVGIYMGNGTTIEATSMSIDEETGEKSGYTLIRNIQNSDSICIVMVARIQY